MQLFNEQWHFLHRKSSVVLLVNYFRLHHTFKIQQIYIFFIQNLNVFFFFVYYAETSPTRTYRRKSLQLPRRKIKEHHCSHFPFVFAFFEEENHLFWLQLISVYLIPRKQESINLQCETENSRFWMFVEW